MQGLLERLVNRIDALLNPPIYIRRIIPRPSRGDKLLLRNLDQVNLSFITDSIREHQIMYEQA